jgi:signal transduction histidine kinase
MLSLQNRIALILVVSMMAVLLIGLAATFFVISRTDPNPSLESAVDSLVILANIDSLPTDPPRGLLLPDPTQSLQAAMEKRGVRGDVRVIEETLTGLRVAAYHLPNGRWATMEVPEVPTPPRGAWLVLTMWLSLTVIGVGTVALIMARRVTEPFGIIERAVASVGPSGELPHFSVDGSAEARRVKTALNSLAGRLKSAMQTRMRLVAAAGHDLRTPMTRMRLRAELLPDEDQIDWFADVDELEQIAESAIGLVREESGAADRTKIDLSSLVRETAEELADADLPVKLGAVEPAFVVGGPLSLRRALRNLITNAATYGGGAIVSVQRTGETVLVQIEDDGPGIPEPMLSQVFEPFFRADPSRGNSKGAGLGLTIANEIIERLGGSLTLENRTAGGLLQVIALPAAPVS